MKIRGGGEPTLNLSKRNKSQNRTQAEHLKAQTEYFMRNKIQNLAAEIPSL